MVLKKIKIGEKYISVISLKLGSKNLIVLSGSRGYVMCGYLNLSVAEKFKDLAVKITGISNVQEALKTKVVSLTSVARKNGIFKGQVIKDVLKIIA